MTAPLAGRLAVVTGGSRGIGLATAALLAAAGARVVRIARSLTAGSEPRFIDLPGDLSDPGAATRLGRTVLDQVGVPDILVNNAGVFQRMALPDATAEELLRQLQVNLVGAFAILQAIVPAMHQAGRGQVITVGSVADATGLPQNSIYSATKYGLRGLHESLAAEYRDTGLRFTLVAPGPTDTSIWDAAPRSGLAPIRARGEMLHPADVAEAIGFVVTRPPSVLVEVIRLMPSPVR